MFDHNHYVPIMRWKRGEYIALRRLVDQEQSRITPLAEIPPERDSGSEKRALSLNTRLDRTAEQIEENWGDRYLFIDLGLLDANLRATGNRHPVTVLFEAARKRGSQLIPVTALDRNAAYQRSVAEIILADKRGACIRLFDRDIANPGLIKQLRELLVFLNLEAESTDILLDFLVVQNAPLTYPAALNRLPDLYSWRTVTIAGGSFPVDLSGLSVGEHLLPRLEWQKWRKLVTKQLPSLRLPTFGDYTTQHPVYRLHLLPPGRINYSASIRYTTDEHWLVMRGEGVFNDDSAGFAQFPANAILLRDRPEFCKRDYSYGDNYIYEKASQLEATGRVKKPGNAETWLRAGVNHHMTFVVHQIANLFGSSNGRAR